MTPKKYRSNYNILSAKKIDSIIIDLKENCNLCKQNLHHDCCINDIIKEWKNIKKEFNGKRKH